MIFEPRQAGGVIGWVSAIAAFGPFFFGVLLSFMAPTILFWGIGIFALNAAAMAWYHYARNGAEKPC
jgi:NNP family nitrate/nitrite transporter-like MFS transporter